MIQRYDELYNYRSHMLVDQDGDYVLYEDHVAAMKIMEDKIDLLEQSLESADGEVSDLMQKIYGYKWPEPPRGGQSSVLFDDGYEEGWAKAVDTIRKDFVGDV